VPNVFSQNQVVCAKRLNKSQQFVATHLLTLHEFLYLVPSTFLSY